MKTHRLLGWLVDRAAISARQHLTHASMWKSSEAKWDEEKKHTAASPRRGLKKRGGITLFRHSSSTCDALRGPTALIYGCVARVWWKIYSCFAFGEAAGLRKAKLFGGTEQLRSEVSPLCQKHLLGVRWTCFSEGESDKTRSSRTKPCISRNFFFLSAREYFCWFLWESVAAGFIRALWGL